MATVSKPAVRRCERPGEGDMGPCGARAGYQVSAGGGRHSAGDACVSRHGTEDACGRHLAATVRALAGHRYVPVIVTVIPD